MSLKKLTKNMQNKKGVIYVRVSSREQKEEGYSIPAQRKLLTDFARTHGITIVKDFEDDETAKTSGRTGFTEMINFIKANKKNRCNTCRKDRSPLS